MDATNTKPMTSLSKQAFAVQAVTIILVLVLVLAALNPILMGRNGTNYVLAGQVDPDETYDVIFAGSSHMNNAVYPMELWEDHGFTAFNNAQSGEVIPISYYTCKYALETYDPKVLVLDVYMLYHGKEYGNLTWAHQSLDHLPAQYRIPAILDLIPNDSKKEFLFPMNLYHSRWKELKKSDFAPSDNYQRGCAQNFVLAEDIIGMTFEHTPADVKVQPAEIPVTYLQKIVDLCRETETELVLVALPYFISSEYDDGTHKMENDQAYFNWVADFAAENGVDYINFFHLFEEIGFDWFQCLYNYSHMNYHGGKIITEYLGKYLTENYPLPDRRDDPAYTHWNEDLEKYTEYRSQKLENA